jgi:hypothetical protein
LNFYSKLSCFNIHSLCSTLNGINHAQAGFPPIFFCPLSSAHIRKLLEDAGAAPFTISQPAPDSFNPILGSCALWLDASDGESMEIVEPYGEQLSILKSWRCRLWERTGRMLQGAAAEEPKAQVEGTSVSAIFHYDAWGRINPPFQRVGTIISLHTQLETAFIKEGKRVCFYILSGSGNHVPLHGNPDGRIVDDWNSREEFRQGKFRKNQENWSVPSEVKFWFDRFEVATLSPTNPISGYDATAGTNRIGRDRECHEFSGKLKELFVFDRVLSDEEISVVENYLLSKWKDLFEDRA